MKLAEALSRRSALIEKSQQLRSRLKDCIKIQEGDEPTEDVDKVITELDQTLDELHKSHLSYQHDQHKRRHR